MTDKISFTMSPRIANALALAARSGFESLDPARSYTIGEARRAEKAGDDIITRDEWTEVEEIITEMENV